MTFLPCFATFMKIFGEVSGDRPVTGDHRIMRIQPTVAREFGHHTRRKLTTWIPAVRASLEVPTDAQCSRISCEFQTGLYKNINKVSHFK